MTEELPLCECGCGLRVAKVGNRFVQHHQNRGRIMSDKQKSEIAKTLTKNPKPDIQLCQCGCGEYAQPGRKFIFGHQHCKTPWKPKPNAALCECGCGEYALPGNRFIKGHETRGVKRSFEYRENLSRIRKGKRCGQDNPNWKGGTSFEPYCPKFTAKLKQQVRDRYDNCDFISGLPDYICNISKGGRFRKLDVHHVDSNKNQGCDNVKWKLVPLSCRNHMRMNGNGAFWERLICYALEYDEFYYNIKQINIQEKIKWKQTMGVILNTF